MQNSTGVKQELAFTTPKGTPYQFAIIITGKKSAYSLYVAGADPLTGLTKAGTFQIQDGAHASYSNVFEKLAADFGLRLPENKKLSVANTAKINYQEVLLENKDSGMLYGYGDPAVIRTEQDGKTVYYLLSTSNDAPDSFPILRSADLTDWTFAGYVFPEAQKPVWAADGEMVSDYWAPEMHKVGNEYRVYFVARDKKSRELCIGMARSSHPEGPFIPDKQPLLKGNVIDPHIYVQDEHTAYLFWKEDNNDVWPSALIELLYKNPELITRLFSNPEDQATASFMITVCPWLHTLEPMERFLFIQVFIEAVIARYAQIYDLLGSLTEKQYSTIAQEIGKVLNYMKTPMFGQQLSADGQTLIGERTKILENDLEWEAHLVEGMWVTHQQGKYYLFYAGNDFSTDKYGIGAAIADSPLGPYHKMSEPFLQSTDKWAAPGHPSVTTSPNGQPIMFLHAYFPGQAGYKQFRALLTVPLQFEASGVRLRS